MKVRPIRIVGDLAYVPLSRGFEAVIDASDVHLVCDHNWYFREGYAHTNINYGDGKRGTIGMHRIIAATPPGFDTDHIDCNKLNNTRANLRHATASNNRHNRSKYKNNTSGYKGVSWSKHAKRWKAVITINSKQKELGYFNTEEQAHIAYCEAAKRLHGEFANFGGQPCN